MFSEIFSELLQIRKITAYKLAKDTGISNGLISAWKSGSKEPSSESLRKLSDYFGVSTDYLLGKTNEKKIHPSANETDECIAVLVDKQKETLLKLVDELCQEDQRTLLEHARFLTSRQKKSTD